MEEETDITKWLRDQKVDIDEWLARETDPDIIETIDRLHIRDSMARMNAGFEKAAQTIEMLRTQLNQGGLS